MNNFLKYGLLAAAGWFVYNNFFKSGSDETDVQETGSNPIPSVNLRSLMQAEVTEKGYPSLMNSWQWGVVYEGVRKVPPSVDPSIAVPEGYNPDFAMSLDEWLGKMINAGGVSGIYRSK